MQHGHRIRRGVLLMVWMMVSISGRVGLAGDLQGKAVRPEKTRPQAAGYESQVRARIDKLIRARSYPHTAGNPGDTDYGKRGWPIFLANLYRMQINKEDPGQQQAYLKDGGGFLINNRWAGSFYKPFTCPGFSKYYFQYKDRMPSGDRKKMLSTVKRDWSMLCRADGKMDPIYAKKPGERTEFNSENFCWMARLCRFQFAHELGDAKKIDQATPFVDNWVRGTFSAGRVEWDSSVYFGYSLQPVLVLFDHAPTAKSKEQARAVADWMFITSSLHYLDGALIGPDVRAKSGCHKPLYGSFLHYAYVFLGLDISQLGHPEAEYLESAPMQSMGFIATTTYRPPQVALDIARRKFETPVEMHNAKPFYFLDEHDYRDWRADQPGSRRFEFETLYLHKHYTLGSLATYRPSGKIGTFWEQSMWRLGVKGDGKLGAVQVFGNAGEIPTSCSRCPYEQIGQYRNVMMRLIKGTDRMWVCIPAQCKQEMEGRQVFADLGQGVYLALLPWQSKGLKTESWWDSKQKKRRGKLEPLDPMKHYQRVQYIWQFDANRLGGLVLEVGTQQEHGSYEQFKKAIVGKAELTGHGSDQLDYISTLGRKLRMQFMPLTTYQLVSTQSICHGKEKGKQVTKVDPAGTVPKVWCDGQLLDYSQWQSYEVVSGPKIVEQQWGSGILTAKVNGKGLQIVVDRKTAAVSYRKIDGE